MTTITKMLLVEGFSLGKCKNFVLSVYTGAINMHILEEVC